MDLETRNKLLALNNVFYDQFASSFSATRHQVQPGVRKLIDDMVDAHTILDVGCGNGTLARALVEKSFQGTYLGVDMSQDLISEAKKLLGTPSQDQFQFFTTDLVSPDWHQSLPIHLFDWLVSFAVLHHIPGKELRNEIVRRFATLVDRKSFLVISVWQWQNSPRLKKRVLPWSTVAIDKENLDEGDVLLDWRAGETPGLRYVHTFDDDELAKLAKNGGFQVVNNFYSDGKSGDLALYQIWRLE